jgi:hypothetical protein
MVAVQLTFSDTFVQRAVFHPARAAGMAEAVTGDVYVASDDFPMMVLSVGERCHGENKSRHQHNVPAGHAAFSNNCPGNERRIAPDFLFLLAVSQVGSLLGRVIFVNA